MLHRLVFLVLLLFSTAWAADPPQQPTLIEQPDAFQTLVNPNCSHCKDEAKRRAGELKDNDRVLCWIRDAKYQGGAIPFRFFLNPYRVISDTYGVFVHDPDAGYARGFAPSLEFTFHGWRNGVMVMKHKDGTLYSCLSGRAFAGPRKGTKLTPVPTVVSDWGYWLKHYPDTVAYHLYDKYKPIELPARGSEGSRQSRGPADKRLNEDALVLGVAEGKEARAYPVQELEKNGLVYDKIDGKECVVLWYAPTRTAAAFQPKAVPPGKGPDAAQAVTLQWDKSSDRRAEVPWVDAATGSHWDVTGRAVDGKLKGHVLLWLDGTQVKWFAWAAEYPETTIYGK
jgi:hypothetical protein